jgi:hypothetical protein
MIYMIGYKMTISNAFIIDFIFQFSINQSITALVSHRGFTAILYITNLTCLGRASCKARRRLDSSSEILSLGQMSEDKKLTSLLLIVGVVTCGAFT